MAACHSSFLGILLPTYSDILACYFHYQFQQKFFYAQILRAQILLLFPFGVIIFAAEIVAHQLIIPPHQLSFP